MPVKRSPLELKLWGWVQSGEINCEKIAVATGISYGTTRNMFTRHIISAKTLLALLHANLISEKEVHDYWEWAVANKKVPSSSLPWSIAKKDSEATPEVHR